MNDEEYQKMIRFIRALDSDVEFLKGNAAKLGPPSDYTRGAAELASQVTVRFLLLLSDISGRSVGEIRRDVNGGESIVDE